MLSDDMNNTGGGFNPRPYGLYDKIDLTGGKTSESVTGSGTGTSTGKSSGINLADIAALINAGTGFLTSFINSIYTGQAIKRGTYYNRYNQGMYNSYNSGSTSLFLITGVVIVVVFLKNN